MYGEDDEFDGNIIDDGLAGDGETAEEEEAGEGI